MRKAFTTSFLVLSAILLVATAHNGKAGLLPGQANLRGASLADVSGLATEWQIASALGDPSGFSNTINGVRVLPPTIYSGEFEYDVTLEAGTPFWVSSFFI